tara:strand:+ start:47781 stop:49373 length:1593 start_codon:yes stop_codon:yes gene_type:complete
MVFSGTVQSDFLKFLPSNLDNKEKLIDFSASDFASIRTALIKYVKATYPLDYNNFSESDFGIMLIELMAAVGHIQANKADYLANENYLKTARSRSSVKKLLELVGVRMKGPISAAANASITITPPSIASPSSFTVTPANRVTSITSPEDGGSLSFTLYKVKADGTIDLDQNSNSLIFDASAVNGTVTITDAVLLEGALVVESGVFQSPDTIKSINLSQFPYVERSAQIFITGSEATAGVYSEEDNIYFASGASDKVFQVDTNDNFTASILFGDSTVGLSPAVGDTYTVSYRVGGGSRGNIATSFLNAPIEGTLDSEVSPDTGVLENISIGTGGSDAESVAHAKRYAPITFRRQDRLVTLVDYKGFINTFVSNYGSTGKANAVVRRAYSSANIIDLFVLEKSSDTQLRKATPEYKRQLLVALGEKKMLTDEPVVVDGLIRTMDVILTVTIDSKYKNNEAQIVGRTRARILEYFNVDNTDFGQAFIPQDLVKFILDINEVRYAEVDNIDRTIKVAYNEVIQLNNLTINSAYL